MMQKNSPFGKEPFVFFKSPTTFFLGKSVAGLPLQEGEDRGFLVTLAVTSASVHFAYNTVSYVQTSGVGPASRNGKSRYFGGFVGIQQNRGICEAKLDGLFRVNHDGKHKLIIARAGILPLTARSNDSDA